MEMKLQQRKSRRSETSRSNLTGIPTQMKMKFEQRSGMSFDDVRVHYDSLKPSAFHADAYTFGTDIYIAPNRRETLPHELGHIIQQKRGIVSYDTRENGLPVSDNPAIEAQAESFGRGNFLIANGRGLHQPRAVAPVVMKSTVHFKRHFPAMKGHVRNQKKYNWQSGRRHRTAFAIMHSNRNQGPHTLPFIAWEVFTRALGEARVDLSQLVGTRILPYPKTAKKIINKILGENKLSSLGKKRVEQYYKLYNKLFQQKKWRRLIELHPVQTYALDRDPTPEEMKGKGESRKKAVKALLSPQFDSSQYDLGEEPEEYFSYKVKKRDKPIKLIAQNENDADLDFSADSEFSYNDENLEEEETQDEQSFNTVSPASGRWPMRGRSSSSDEDSVDLEIPFHTEFDDSDQEKPLEKPKRKKRKRAPAWNELTDDPNLSDASGYSDSD